MAGADSPAVLDAACEKRKRRGGKVRRPLLLTFAKRGDTPHQEKPYIRRSLPLAKINNNRTVGSSVLASTKLYAPLKLCGYNRAPACALAAKNPLDVG